MKRVETVSPGAGVVSARRGTWASWTTRARRAASSRASLTFGSMVSRARRRTSRGTRVCARSTPSNRLVYSRTAAPPRTRTSSVIGFTRSTARSTSRAARGSTPSSACLVSPSAARPRRSITVVTGLTPLSEVTCPVYEDRRPVAEPSACWTAACLACLACLGRGSQSSTAAESSGLGEAERRVPHSETRMMTAVTSGQNASALLAPRASDPGNSVPSGLLPRCWS